MNLIVLTPEQKVFSGEIKAIKAPGMSGQFEILNGHAPIVSSLTNGNVKITTQSGEIKNFTIEKGFIEVLYNEVSLLVQGYSAN